MCRLFMVVLLILPGAAVVAADAGDCDQWQQIRITTAGTIYQRCRPGSVLPEMMIRTVFQATPGKVHARVTDYDRFAGFIPNVRESRVLDRADTGTEWVFHQLRFPGPVADRVYVIRSSDHASRPQDGYYRVEWELSGRVFPVLQNARGVRPDAFDGFWDLRPIEDGKATDASYSVYSDPGGLVPAWLVTRMTGRYLQQVIMAVRKRLKQ